MTTQRATCWSVTINNPTFEDEEAIAIARQMKWKVEGQLEKGKEGTLHYQLLVRTPQVRFSALKKQFPRAHIEVARNTVALENYVNKEDTRESALPTSQEMYPSLSKFWTLVVNEIDAYNRTADMSYDTHIPLTLAGLDYATERLIYKGYHVESTSVNPQVRASWNKFASAIAARARASQTDRQTDTDIQQDNVLSISIPTYAPSCSQVCQGTNPSGTSPNGSPPPGSPRPDV